MSYSVDISRKAEEDLNSIFAYIADELCSIQNASAQLDRLERAILSLQDMPERYRLYDREPWRSRGLRILPVDHYCVFYIADHDSRRVDIIRVLYGRRDLDKALKET